MSVTETDIVIISMVVQEFLDTRKATLRRPLIIKGKSPEILDKLCRWSILDTDDQRTYLPKALAFHYCGNAHTLLLAKRSVEMLARVLIALFPESPEDKFFLLEEIEKQYREMFGEVDPQQIRLGLFLAQEFNLLAGWKGNRAEMEAARINEYVVQIDNPAELWDVVVKRKTDWISTQVAESPPAHVPEAVVSPEQVIDVAEFIGDSPEETVEEYGGWQVVRPLGNQTGQAVVSLVRSPQRVAEIARAETTIRDYTYEQGQRQTWSPHRDRTPAFASAVLKSARADSVSELGALKVFKLRGDGAEAEKQLLDRLKGEIQILKQGRPGLLRLLASSEQGRWIITEYQSGGTLHDNPNRFKGNAALALRAFRLLVHAVEGLHSEGIVHRDIKPANVFLGNEGDLILGDFGIVYLPEQSERVTRTNERVGPFDYMPTWADMGERLEKVEPNFDVYMLGKLLWCMVSGKLKLPREYFRESEFDLTRLFPDDQNMQIINSILDKCVVERAKDCMGSAKELLGMVDVCLRIIDRNGQLLDDKIPRPCRVCGMGHYHLKLVAQNTPVVGLRFWINGSDTSTVPIRVFVCDNCKHVELFSGS
jgi:serine/threonine protein kinase